LARIPKQIHHSGTFHSPYISSAKSFLWNVCSVESTSFSSFRTKGKS
jgi:hypothetical protein